MRFTRNPSTEKSCAWWLGLIPEYNQTQRYSIGAKVISLIPSWYDLPLTNTMKFSTWIAGRGARNRHLAECLRVSVSKCMTAFQSKSLRRCTQTSLVQMTALFRVPSVGGVVHMTANSRTVQAKDIPAFTVSLRRKVTLASSISTLPIGCLALGASLRHRHQQQQSLLWPWWNCSSNPLSLSVKILVVCCDALRS